MSAGPRELAALSRLAGAASDAAEARLRALRAEAEEIRGRLRSLDEAWRARAAEAWAPDAALRAGADLKWEGWIEGRRAALNAELARVMARAVMAEGDLRRAFGRRTATEALAGDAQAAWEARRARKDEREG